MWKQWVNAIIGVGTIAVPFIGLAGITLAWTLAVMGAIVLALSIWTMSEVSPEDYARVTHHRHSHA